jgi:hypothetical protein
MTQEMFECGGEILGGKLKLEGLTVFKQTIARFPDGPVTLRITVGKRQRSLAQNAYFHGVVLPLFAEHTGYSTSEMKDAIALHLLPQEIVDIKTGEVVTVPGHTSKLTIGEFNDFIVRVQQLGSEMGIYVPDPNEVTV